MTEPKDYGVQLPNKFIDEHLRHLVPYELPVLLVIMRKTRGALQEKVTITDEEMYELTGLPLLGMQSGIETLNDYWKMIKVTVHADKGTEYELVTLEREGD